ncbi:hypothetical protein B0H63DRAFT_445227 [Podospora didyma]|uniref:Apple domain-containing protein n=1 Tax=Podospora didyma TaxID=330526 RepID=A0AAE0P8C9_9PEZI|nr:hypothetical protein B0H63DRAFT_445227 [Podospora didyma]
MANAEFVAANRHDLEGMQALPGDVDSGQGLHPTSAYTPYSQSQASAPKSPSQNWTTTESNGMYAAAGYNGGHNGGYNGGYNGQDHLPPSDGKRILGLRRTTLFLIITNIALAVALIAVGVTQSQAVRNAQNANSAQLATCNANLNSTNGGNTTTPNELQNSNSICFVTNSVIPNKAPGTPSPQCPNNLPTTEVDYKVPGTNLTFRRFCETDYPGSDLAQMPATSMLDCLALCAQLNIYQTSTLGPCVGVSWVYGDGKQGTGTSFCYPKSLMRTGGPKVGVESASLLTGNT